MGHQVATSVEHLITLVEQLNGPDPLDMHFIVVPPELQVKVLRERITPDQLAAGWSVEFMTEVLRACRNPITRVTSAVLYRVLEHSVDDEFDFAVMHFHATAFAALMHDPQTANYWTHSLRDLHDSEKYA